MSRIFVSEDKQSMVMLLKGTVETINNGSKMIPMGANTVDAAVEKHVPAVKVDGKTVSVKVGSVEHPMTEAHLIEWIYLQTKKGGQYRHLTPADKPEATFIVADDDEPIAVYEHCNLHGLWKASV